MEKIKGKEKKKIKVPHILVLLLIMMVIAMIATWLVPAGVYERIEGPNGRMMVNPNNFTWTAQQPVNIFKLFEALPIGMTQAGMISFTIFIIGGAWQVINRTGAIAAGISSLSNKLKGRETLAIPILMFIFAFISCFIGALELCVVYVPVIIPLCFALGFDTLTAVAIAFVASGGAFAAALTNPFTVGIAQNIAGLPLYSGLAYRIIVLVTFTLVGMLFVIRYAKKVKSNPKSSLVFNESKIFEKDLGSIKTVEFSTKHKLIILVLLLGLISIVYGVLRLHWFMYEIGAVFFIIALLSAIFGRLSADEFANEFVEGCKSVTIAALIVGFARSILVIIEAGGITDTIIKGLVYMVRSLPDSITVVGIFISQSLFNFLVPSGSGQTLITMPILAPLADVVGITRQSVVLATQLGDGITNILYPVSGILMAILAYTKIPYQKWVKFIFPLILIWTGLGCIFLIIAQTIKWGPF